MLSVVSHIHIARNLGSLINVIKISQQMFDYHESHHLLCITEVFRNSKKQKAKKKNPQNKTKNITIVLIVAVLSALYIISLKLNHFPKLHTWKRAGLEFQSMDDSSADIFLLHHVPLEEFAV